MRGVLYFPFALVGILITTTVFGGLIQKGLVAAGVTAVLPIAILASLIFWYLLYGYFAMMYPDNRPFNNPAHRKTAIGVVFLVAVVTGFMNVDSWFPETDDNDGYVFPSDIIICNGLGTEVKVTIGEASVKVKPGIIRTYPSQQKAPFTIKTTVAKNGKVVEHVKVKSLIEGQSLVYNVKKRAHIVVADYSGLFVESVGGQALKSAKKVSASDIKIVDLQERSLHRIPRHVDLLPVKGRIPKSFDSEFDAESKATRIEKIPAKVSDVEGYLYKKLKKELK